jgi:hypothetical protein
LPPPSHCIVSTLPEKNKPRSAFQEPLRHPTLAAASSTLFHLQALSAFATP